MRMYNYQFMVSFALWKEVLLKDYYYGGGKLSVSPGVFVHFSGMAT